MRLRYVACTISAAMLLAGCGSSSPKALTSGDGALSVDQADQVAHANLAIAAYCLHQSQGASIPQSEFAAEAAGIDTLSSVFRASPSATYDQRTMRQVLSDAATQLQSCDPPSSATLDRVLASS